MSYPVYGRFQTAEPLSALASLHIHDGSPLKTSDHETPLGVLDQSDLLTQGIHTSKFIPGCKADAEALGSCTANATTEGLAAGLPEEEWVALGAKLVASESEPGPTGYADVVGGERMAIGFYRYCTAQTGTPSEEWPPTDCGSSGPYIVSALEKLGVVKGQKIATPGESLLSLLQGGGALMGSPWFYSWEEPDAAGFIDGDGTAADLEAAIQSGVAGGHETRLAAIEKIAFLPTGHVDPANTVLRDRNSWSRSWGDNGCCRIHLSTLIWLAGQIDLRQLQA